MAKSPKSTELAVVEQKSTAVAPAFLGDKKYKGAGVSTAAEDNKVSMLAVLQPLSPEVDEGSAKFIEGAKPGDILLKGLPNPIIKGDTGILFVPCFFDKAVVEWVPRVKGGGYVARHKTMPANARRQKNQQTGREEFVNPENENQLIETRYHAGLVVLQPGLAVPYVIPFTSTGHDVSRQWHTLMNNVRDADGDVPASFSRVYELTTVRKQNKAGTWFMLSVNVAEDTDGISSDGWVVDEKLYRNAANLYESFASNQLEMGEEEQAGGGRSTDRSKDAF